MKLQKTALLLFTLFTITICGQTEKGNIFIGASSNLNTSFINYSSKSDNSSKVEHGKGNSFSLSPKIGFLLIDNLVFGAGIDLGFGSFESQQGGGESKSTSLSFSPFTRYYFLEGEFKPFLNAKYSFGSNKNTFINQNGNDSESKSSNNTLELGGGVSYFINEIISIELGINYTRNSAKQTDNNPANIRNITSGITSAIGFAIFL